MSGSRISAGKLALFTDPLKELTEEEIAVYIAAGYELGLVPAGQGGVGMMFVERGDPAAEDFTAANFTADGAWHDLDLSAIVPAGAVAVLLAGVFTHVTAGKAFLVRKHGNVNTKAVAAAESVVAGGEFRTLLLVSCSAARHIDYYADNAAWGTLNITVAGWFK
jgi:hypothetical protein